MNKMISLEKAIEVVEFYRTRIDPVPFIIESLRDEAEREQLVNDSPELDKKNGELIKRREAIDRFNLIRPVDPRRSEYTYGIDVGIAMCIATIKDQSSVQPEVIRCRECRWRNDGGHWLGCPVLNVDDDNYCSYAERTIDE